jgi:hypothetical protein|eukprot:COSAG06_NODE_2618_length_6574_cov_3.416988_2_plen_84_part_00
MMPRAVDESVKREAHAQPITPKIYRSITTRSAVAIVIPTATTICRRRCRRRCRNDERLPSLEDEEKTVSFLSALPMFVPSLSW